MHDPGSFFDDDGIRQSDRDGRAQSRFPDDRHGAVQQ